MMVWTPMSSLFINKRSVRTLAVFWKNLRDSSRKSSRLEGPSIGISNCIESVAVMQPIDKTMFSAPYHDLLVGGSSE
jgi:hypothetical protein